MTKLFRAFYQSHLLGGSHQRIRHKILSFLEKSNLHIERYLDIGCADGDLTLEVARRLRQEEVYGVDLSEAGLKNASMRGIRTRIVDIESERLPFSDEYFGAVSAFEVIEHLVNTDNLISESHRVLKRGGLFIISTPNLASWLNRLYLLFGYLPRNYEVSLKYKFGFIITGPPVGHVRLYTLGAIKKHLELYGFHIVKVLGAAQPISAHKKSNPTFRLAGMSHNCIETLLGRFPSLSNNFAVVAKKVY